MSGTDPALAAQAEPVIMRLYEADTGGAVYWVGAPTLVLAMAALIACWEREGSADDVDELDLQDVTDLPRAQRLAIRCDGGDGANVRMLDEIRTIFTPTVIACSEWP